MAELPLPNARRHQRPSRAQARRRLAHALAKEIHVPPFAGRDEKRAWPRAQLRLSRATGDPMTVRTVRSSSRCAGAASRGRDGRRRSRLPGSLVAARPSSGSASSRSSESFSAHVDHAVSFDRAVVDSADSEHHRRAHGDSTLGKQAEDWAARSTSFDQGLDRRTRRSMWTRTTGMRPTSAGSSHSSVGPDP